MKLVRHHAGWVIALTFVLALMLAIYPLPDTLALWRPEWVTLVLVYWCIALPQRVGVGVGWALGLMEDVLRGALLGQYALTLALTAYLALLLHKRLRIYPLWQQSLVVLMLVALQQMLVLWVQGIVGRPLEDWSYWLPSLASMLLWPWVFLILRDLRRRFRVS